MAISFKGAHFPQDIILMGVRWYVAYPLSYRHVEELMEERGVPIDHATIQRWVVKYSPQLEEAFHRRKRAVWVSWRMDETYIKMKGQWYYLYRAVDKHGQTIDFLLTEPRDEQAAKRFLTKAIRRHGVPEKITIDGSAANEAGIKSYNTEHGCEFYHLMRLDKQTCDWHNKKCDSFYVIQDISKGACQAAVNAVALIRVKITPVATNNVARRIFQCEKWQ
jgi:putative transposase